MPDHDDFFRRGAYEEYYPDQMQERPNTELKVRFRPNQSKIPSQLTSKLWKDYNMELSPSTSNRDIFVVSGIPPNNGFGEHEVMEVVRKYAPNAQVVQESSQCGGGRG